MWSCLPSRWSGTRVLLVFHMNNINLTALQQSIEKAKTDTTVLQIPLNLEGEWRMDETKPQFGGSFKIPSGEEVMQESDFPPFLGGGGRRPSPLQYCFWGGMACYASTFMLTAVSENIPIKRMKIRTTGTIDFNQAVGLGDSPPISGLTWEISVESDAAQEELDRLNTLAEERCPASWMMKNIVEFKARVKKM